MSNKKHRENKSQKLKHRIPGSVAKGIAVVLLSLGMIADITISRNLDVCGPIAGKLTSFIYIIIGIVVMALILVPCSSQYDNKNAD